MLVSDGPWMWNITRPPVLRSLYRVEVTTILCEVPCYRAATCACDCPRIGFACAALP